MSLTYIAYLISFASWAVALYALRTAIRAEKVSEMNSLHLGMILRQKVKEIEVASGRSS